MPDRPIPESYWVEPGRLLAGEYPGKFDVELTRQRIDALLQAGFTSFIDLTRPNETVVYDRLLYEEASLYQVKVSHQRFAIGDYGLPTPELMTRILDTLDAELAAGRKVYLHCWGGIGRTGTTVGCYLVRRGLSGEAALHQVAAWWRTVPKSSIHVHSPETPEQAQFVLHWAQNDSRNP